LLSVRPLTFCFLIPASSPTQAAYTYDAGPNCVIYCRPQDSAMLLSLIGDAFPPSSSDKSVTLCLLLVFVCLFVLLSFSLLLLSLVVGAFVPSSLFLFPSSPTGHSLGLSPHTHQLIPILFSTLPSFHLHSSPVSPRPLASLSTLLLSLTLFFSSLTASSADAPPASPPARTLPRSPPRLSLSLML
jgi:hypothetical protein